MARHEPRRVVGHDVDDQVDAEAWCQACRCFGDGDGFRAGQRCAVGSSNSAESGRRTATDPRAGWLHHRRPMYPVRTGAGAVRAAGRLGRADDVVVHVARVAVHARGALADVRHRTAADQRRQPRPPATGAGRVGRTVVARRTDAEHPRRGGAVHVLAGAWSVVLLPLEARHHAGAGGQHRHPLRPRHLLRRRHRCPVVASPSSRSSPPTPPPVAGTWPRCRV